LIKAVKMYAKGTDKSTIVKEITRELNLGYADTIYKIAKLIVEGARSNSSNPLKAKIKKLFVASRGFSSNRGNRNIRLVSTRGGNFKGLSYQQKLWLTSSTLKPYFIAITIL